MRALSSQRGSDPRRSAAAAPGRLPAILAAFFAFAAAQAEAQGVQALISRNEITINEAFILQVQVTRPGRGARPSPPELPPLPDFEVQGLRQSQQVQIVNGDVSTGVTYEYSLRPSKVGRFVIGPVKAQIEDRTFASQPIRVRVVEAGATPQAASEHFIRATVSDTTPYVGQQVIYTWRFFRRVAARDARLGAESMDGFLQEPLGDVREYETTLDGQRYAVSELRRALFPQEEGEVTLRGPRLEFKVPVRTRNRRSRSAFDDFLGRTRMEARSLETPAIRLEVRPLPAAPPGFSGLVGEFDITSRASKNQLRVGESTTLRVSISGSGNVKMISSPRMPELPAFKIYDDTPETSIDATTGGLRGRKTYRKAVVPQAAGAQEIPALSLVYFDPGAGSYVTAEAPAIPLEILPGNGEEELDLTESVAPTTGKVSVRILADDILPIHKGLEALGGDRLRGWIGGLWTAGLFVPPLAFLGFWLLQRREERFRRDRGLKRRQGALRKATTALGQLDGDPRQAAEQASRALREYIGDKLNVEGSALTAEETGTLLRRVGIDEALADQVHRRLSRLEAAQYGGAAPGGDLGTEIHGLVKDLEKAFKEGRR